MTPANAFVTCPTFRYVSHLSLFENRKPHNLTKPWLTPHSGPHVFQVTSALAYMHSLDIIHRDLKPENLLLTSKDSNAEVKVIDFGLAKILGANDHVAQSFLGTRVSF